jgi:dihydroorotase
VETGLLDWAGVADRMSARPARIGGLADHGRGLGVDAPAHLTLVDPGASRVIEARALQSLSRNTPYAGMKLPGAVVATFLRGEPTVLDRRVVER